MNRWFSLPAPAKLNLALRITGRRSDGFHTLDTLFERIDLADTLTFAPAPEGCLRVTCDHPEVPCDSRNLICRAALLLQKATGTTQGAAIRIRKRIPVAAGLGGGSSDAATALRGLNRLWALGLSRARLVDCARALGSDVPFFLYDVSFARGTDRGDRIRPVAVSNRFWHVLVTDDEPLLTADVFRAYARHFAGRSLNGDVPALVRALRRGDPQGVGALLANDLEAPVGRLRPDLLRLRDMLRGIAPLGVCFSGSGPTLFALAASRRDAERLAAPLRRRHRQVFVVRTM